MTSGAEQRPTDDTEDAGDDQHLPRSIESLLGRGGEADLDTEARLARLENALHHVVEDAYLGDSDGSPTDDATLSAEVTQLRERVAELESTVSQLSGLAEDEESTSLKRQRDIAIGLLNEARATSNGRTRWRYDDALTHLRRNRHETVHPPQVYRAMEKLDERVEGFVHTEDENDDQVLVCNAADAPTTGEAIDAELNQSVERPARRLNNVNNAVATDGAGSGDSTEVNNSGD